MSMETFFARHGKNRQGRFGGSSYTGGNIQLGYRGYTYRRPFTGERERWMVSVDGIDLGLVKRVHPLGNKRPQWRTYLPACGEFRKRHQAAVCLHEQKTKEDAR